LFERVREAKVGVGVHILEVYKSRNASRSPSEE